MKIRGKFKIAIYFVVLLMLIGIDQFTKYVATAKLEGKDPFVIIDGVFEFNFLEGGNSGAAWGILSGQTTFFIVTTLIVCLLIILVLLRLEKLIKNKWGTTGKLISLQVMFITLMAGAIGNLIDRIANGYVVDFIYFKLIDFPIFNVADCYVTCSAFLLVVFCIFFVSDEEFSKIFSLKKSDKDIIEIEAEQADKQTLKAGADDYSESDVELEAE